MTTELFNRDGKLQSTLIETTADGIITQEWRHEPGVRALSTAQPCSVEVNVRLADADNVGYVASAADADRLIAAWLGVVAQPGFRMNGRGGEDGARAFLSQTGNRGVLHATRA